MGVHVELGVMTVAAVVPEFGVIVLVVAIARRF